MADSMTDLSETVARELSPFGIVDNLLQELKDLLPGPKKAPGLREPLPKWNPETGQVDFPDRGGRSQGAPSSPRASQEAAPNSLLNALNRISLPTEQRSVFPEVNAAQVQEKLANISDPRQIGAEIPGGQDELISALLGNMPVVGGMAKVFKAAPNTVEGVLQRLIQQGETLPTRGRLRPTIQILPSGELIQGGIGGRHPHDIAANLLNARGVKAGASNLKFGYTLPEEGAAFIPDVIAGYASAEGAPQKLLNMIQKLGLDEVINLINQGRGPGL